MTYIDGFVVAVPTANKEAYRQHAAAAAPLFHEFGATRLVEAWGDDVPRGKLNDFWGAVEAEEGEAIVFSWIEYPDRATRDAAGKRMMEDPRMAALGAMPFDGARMIYSGFRGLHETGPGGAPGYVDGFTAPIADGESDGYAAFCRQVDALFVEHGATRVVDAWGDDLLDGKRTDFKRATHLKDGETVVFGWIEWTSKQARDAAWGALASDARMAALRQPFDGQRMMFGGFIPIVDA